VIACEACKKRIKAFEEEFEQQHGYRVSLECCVVKSAISVSNKLSRVLETWQEV